MTASAPSAGWSAAKKVAFRFAASYCVFYFVTPLVLWSVGLDELYEGRLMTWLGQNILGLPTARLPGHICGDRTNEYITVFASVVAAGATSAAWSLLDRQRPDYRILGYWLAAAARYYLAFLMLHYAFVKILKSQFPFPEPSALIRTVGESSPMGLMWAFMGYSTAYCVFIGLSEAVGATLLFFRRTTTLGALITTSVMLNVLVLNIFYDVCVKLKAAHMLVLAVALVALDAPRLLHVLVLNRPVGPRDLGRPRFEPRVDLALRAGKWVLIVGLSSAGIFDCWQRWQLVGAPAPRPAVYGVWSVESFHRGGAAQPDDPTRWKLLAIDLPARALTVARQVNDELVRFGMQLNPMAKTILLTPWDGDEGSGIELSYEQPSPDTLVLTGQLAGAPATIRMKRRALEQLQLIRHRSRWASDLPE